MTQRVTVTSTGNGELAASVYGLVEGTVLLLTMERDAEREERREWPWSDPGDAPTD